MNGERSKYFGPQGLSLNYSAGTNNTNLNSGLFWQSVKASNMLKTQIRQAPPLGPLVAGYNSYLKSGQLKDPACESKAWIRPIDLNDRRTDP